ncbi:GH92 family glycosyl hydrolase [Actinacidiphila acididurans]|uniref:GH92 family glycosyl hydrolase n=1 Tax=Actinacidiphila acididurans TaxID=2784346 RepID=A0ABS2TS32_9ACTN|nr:GH92 family glycosyl hydrolase [Actinacidiphila acididurans]MBM9506147.1 GH92 family glycosyl hydrolase [Actinacidiphila acididurans]
MVTAALVIAGLTAVPEAADAATLAPADPAGLVAPLAGTAAGGGTYPGAALPFGMVQFSPNTESAEGGGYEYTNPKTWGFGLNHLSGPGCAAMGDVTSLPLTGSVKSLDPHANEVTFDHATEDAHPGSYAVDLAGVHSELTATTRTGWARYTFPSGSTPGVLVSPGGGFRGVSTASIDVVGDHTVEGSVGTYGYFNTCPSKSYNHYTVYFSMQFDQPFSSFATGSGTTVKPGQASATGAGSGAYLSFSSHDVVAKVGISYVSLDGARGNLAAEGTTGFDFDGVRTAAESQWNALLSRVEIQGGTAGQQSTFYTALYHSLLDPNVYSDANGDYTGFDGAVHHESVGHAHYTAFSMWDTYRAQQQVLDLVAPERVADMAHSLLEDAQQGGWMPKWPYAQFYTNEMVGDPAANLLTDAYLKGLLRPEDVRPIYGALVKNATRLPDPSQTPFEGRTGLAEYLNEGFVPLGSTGDYTTAVSDQLEYGVNDCALSLYAGKLGENADAGRFLDRSQRYTNVIDPQTGFVQPRRPDGSWLTPFDPASETGFKEGSAWHYTWLVPQDVTGLANALGGVGPTVAKLDQFFSYDQLTANPASVAGTKWGAEDQYNPTNETDLQAPYLYNYLGRPWKTEDVVRAAETLYNTSPTGVTGNDDLGTMSSWYVLSSLGLYPFFAGADQYTLTSPLFTHAVVHLRQPWYHSSQLVIDAPGASASNRYIDGLTLNNTPVHTSVISHSAIENGATVHFDLGDRPSDWATGSGTPVSPCSATAHTADVRITGVTSTPGSAGDTGTMTVRLTNAGNTAANHVTISAKGPWPVPAATLPALAPGHSATATLTITAPSGTKPGSYPVTVTTDWSGNAGSGSALTTFTNAQYQVAASSLSQLFDTVGTSPDANRSVGNLDGGHNSLSRDALAAAGLTPGAPVAVGGAALTWPTSAIGEPDDVVAAGQAIQLSAPGNAGTLAILATAGSGGPITATGQLVYTDGTVQPYTLHVSDWTMHHDQDQLLAGETVAAKMSYRNLASGPQQTSTYVFGVTVPVDASKTIASVVLPSGYSGRLNVFAMAFGHSE